MTRNQEELFRTILGTHLGQKKAMLAEVIHGQTIAQCIPTGAKALAVYASLGQGSIWSVGGIRHDTAGGAANQMFRLDAPPGTYLDPTITFEKSSVNGAYILYTL